MIKTTCFAVITLFFLLTGPLQSPAQNRKFTVTGAVSDANTKLPLPNVNISIVGTSGGGTTNADGEFSLTLTRIPSVLYFSYVGYSIDSYQVEKSNEKNIRILLQPETKEIEEVTIRAERISKVIRGDTLNIIDFEIDSTRIILIASPYKHINDKRIYLANLNGDTLSHLNVKGAGKQIKFPENMSPQTEYLFRDFTGQVQFLDKRCAHEIEHTNDALSLSFETPYSDFIDRVLPVKCDMNGKLVFQVSTVTENYTFYFGYGAIEGKPIKYVLDRKGPDRYVRYSKNVSAPVLKKGNEVFVFDFFSSNFEVFDNDLNPVRKVPISFQNTMVKEGMFFQRSALDVDVNNFTQTILYDEKAGKAYAFFKIRSTNRQSLREVNLETGNIDRIIEIPEYPNISNIRVHDNVVYFMYDAKMYPFSRLLYRMTI